MTENTDQSDTNRSSESNKTVTDRDAVWQPFVDGLRAFITQRVPEAEAEDVLQETLVRLHEVDQQGVSWEAFYTRGEAETYFEEEVGG